MSSVIATTIQADKMIAENGDETKEVAIPGLNNKLIFAMSNFDASKAIVRKSINISSFVKKTTGVYFFTIRNPAPTNEYLFSGSASGGRYIVSPEDIGATFTKRFTLYVKRASNETPSDRDNCSILVYYTSTKT